MAALRRHPLATPALFLMRRVTLRDIAEEAQVSVMSVSLALRGQGRLLRSTRQRIQEIAKRLGYRPDPALSALVYHRNEAKDRTEFCTVAFLTSMPTRHGWRDVRYIREYYDGAYARAEKLGYHVEAFWTREPGMSAKRMQQILETRGIKGLLVGPVFDRTGSIDLEWDQFCAVSLCRNLIWPKINVVDHNHHHSMTLAWRELESRGYHRVGYAVGDMSEAITGYLWLATHLSEQLRSREPQPNLIPPLIAKELNHMAFLRWFHKERPDVVVSPNISTLVWMREEGIAVPEEVGFLHLEAEQSGPVSGICQHFDEVGATGVELLHNEILRSETGMPPVRQSIAIDGGWTEGATLRPHPEEDVLGPPA